MLILTAIGCNVPKIVATWSMQLVMEYTTKKIQVARRILESRAKSISFASDICCMTTLTHINNAISLHHWQHQL